MTKYTPQQRLQIVKIYYKNSESVRATFRALRDEYGRHNRPSEQAIRAIIDRFETKFTLLDQKAPIRARSARSNENIAAVRANVAEISVTVNGERYRAMIRDFLWPELEQLEDMDLDEMWFQQDGAPCHFATETIDLLEEKFGGSIIARNGPVPWPPRSCDLTPLDFFLWGYLKSLVYANKPQTIEDLKTNIEHEIRAIQPALLVKVTENWVYRMRACKRGRGGHLSDILFRT